jgi:CHAT domain-containing protein
LLVYADPDGNLPLARKEVEQIGESLRQEWGDKIEVELLMPPDSSGRRLNAALRKGQYDVIHYAGHAGFDKTDGDLSGLLLHGRELFFAQKVRRLLEGRPLVFINACESASTANEQQPQRIDRYLQGPAEGLASAFIYGGAVGYIGSLWPVYDGPAAEFAVSVYHRVLEGYTIGEAVRLARLDSRQAHPDQITWATFVLYGDPQFRLVD